VRLAAATGTLATSVVLGMGCQPEFDEARLRAIDPAIDAPCDPDGVELAYDTEYFSSEGEHVLRSIEVRDLDPACVGATVRLDVAGDAGALAGGSATVSGDGRARVLFDPVTEVVGADGETFLQSNLDVRADDVRAVTITID
jgi:hypothetical protein